MTKFAHLTLCAVLITTTINSCKKGEDDPSISLRSRKARITGEWKLTSGEVKEVNPIPVMFGETYTATTIYNGTTATTETTFTDLNTGETSSGTETQNFSLRFNFKKDGTYTKIQTDQNNAITITKGTWIFARKSKNNGLKNKEAILLAATQSGSNTGTITGIGPESKIMVIKQLKNKEMILTASSSESVQGSFHSKDESYTLTLD